MAIGFTSSQVVSFIGEALKTRTLEWKGHFQGADAGESPDLSKILATLDMTREQAASVLVILQALGDVIEANNAEIAKHL